MFTLYLFYGECETNFTPIAKFETNDRDCAEEKMLENFETIFPEEVEMVEYGRKELKAGRCNYNYIKLFGERESEEEGVIEKIKRECSGKPGEFLKRLEKEWKRDVMRIRCYILIENGNFPVEVLKRTGLVEYKKCTTF
jgi:hypothetical protein